MSDRISELLARVPTVDAPPARNDEAALATLRDGLDERLGDWALAVGGVAAEAAIRDVSPARFDVIAEPLGRAIESISIELVKYLLEGRYHATGVRVSQAQRQSTLDAARFGIPLTRIVGGLRALDHRWRAALIELALTPPVIPDAAALLTRLDLALGTYFGALADQNTQIYTEEHQRLLDLRVLGQRQLLERIIAGAQVDDGTVAEALGIAPHDEHTAVIVSAADGSDLDFAAFRQRLARRVAPRTITSVPVDRDTVWIFVSGLALDPGAARDAASGTRGAVVSLGLPAVGTAGIRTSHLTAQAAHALGRLPGAGPVVSYADDGALALAVQSPELARLFVSREIGPLLGTGPLLDELRETLRTLIDRGGSLVRTADALYVHRNTIAYRLKRLEELLGRDPLSRPMETQLALRLAAHLAG